MTQTEQSENDELTQLSYEGTPYEDASWEVVGQAPGEEIFIPMQIEVMQQHGIRVDPMFADYGGLPNAANEQRWHLPEHLATQSMDAIAKEEEEAKFNKLTDEELQKIIFDAEQRGHARAIEEMVGSQNEKLAGVEKRMGAIIQDIQMQLSEHIAAVEKEAVQLAIEISNKIINFAVEINPEYIAQIVQAALNQCGSASISKIRVSPEDMEFIDIVGIAKNIKNFDMQWKFESDATIRSGCVLETSAGEVDYQLDKAWDRVKDNILKVIK